MCGAWVRDRRCPIILVTLRLSTFPTTPYRFWHSYKEANSDSPLFLSDHILHEHLENNTTMSHEESVPDAHSNPASPGGEQTGLSSPEQASPRLTLSSYREPIGTFLHSRRRKAAQTASTRPTSASSDPTVLHSKLVSTLPQEHAAEVSTPADVRPRVVSARLQVPAPVYEGPGSGRDSRAREDIPRRSVRVMRSDATLDTTVAEAAYAPRSVAFPRLDSSYRRSASHYLDSESAWPAREPVSRSRVTLHGLKLKSVCAPPFQVRELIDSRRLAPTVGIVNDELDKAAKRGKL